MTSRTEADVVTAMLALNARHTKQDKRDCGALTDPQPCRYGIQHPDHPERVRTHPYNCTLEPGHTGAHKDQLHCWAFETFDEDLVVTYQPRDLSTCSHCGSYWPCESVTELSECLPAKYTMREVMPGALSGEEILLAPSGTTMSITGMISTSLRHPYHHLVETELGTLLLDSSQPVRVLDPTDHQTTE